MVEQARVDHAAIRTGQIMVILSLIAAFILNSWQIVGALAVVFLLTAISQKIGPFVLFYRFILAPLGLVKPDLRVDNMEPHRFGQAVGVVTAALAAYLLYMGQEAIGWAIVWLLIALTAISFLGWCVGCFIYYMINKMGAGGFFRHAPQDKSVFVGVRSQLR